MLTARLLADDAMRAVPAGSRLPQATVALDPEAGVWRQHRWGHVVRLPVAVGHFLVLAPHQAAACSGNHQTHAFKGAEASVPSMRLLNTLKCNFNISVD